MNDEQWAKEAVRALLARCIRATASRLQDDADALLVVLLRWGIR